MGERKHEPQCTHAHTHDTRRHIPFKPVATAASNYGQSAFTRMRTNGHICRLRSCAHITMSPRPTMRRASPRVCRVCGAVRSHKTRSHARPIDPVGWTHFLCARYAHAHVFVCVPLQFYDPNRTRNCGLLSQRELEPICRRINKLRESRAQHIMHDLHTRSHVVTFSQRSAGRLNVIFIFGKYRRSLAAAAGVMRMFVLVANPLGASWAEHKCT